MSFFQSRVPFQKKTRVSPTYVVFLFQCSCIRDLCATVHPPSMPHFPSNLVLFLDSSLNALFHTCTAGKPKFYLWVALPAKAAISLAMNAPGLANQTGLVLATFDLTALGVLSAGCITSLLVSVLSFVFPVSM